MRLKEIYQKKAAPALKERFGRKNILAVPRLLKATVNVGVGRLTKDRPFIDGVAAEVAAITGQRAVLNAAKKSISAFKVRQGDIVGVMAVLRGQRMYDFVEKLINITLPRVRDFRGLDESMVDGRGNLTIGFREHTAFPEVKMEQVEKVHGLEVTITTNAKSRAEGLALLKLLGFPFKKMTNPNTTN